MEQKTKPGCVSLSFIWGIRLKLYAEGNKLYAEGNKLWAEGNKLQAEGNDLWAEAILEVYGNIKIKWEGDECHLETGEVFKP